MNDTASDVTGANEDAGSWKEELEAFAKKGGALVFGVADAQAFDAAQEGHRPNDFLPGARSVIVLGGAQPRAGDWLSPKYQHMEVTSTTDRMTALCNRMAQHVEQTYGYYAQNVPPGVDAGGQPFVSIALAAELAGCGSASLAGPVLHPELGFMYFGAVITTLPLEPSPPPERAACPADECVDMWQESGTTPCMSVCPIEDGGCLGGSLDEHGVIASRQYDQARCRTRVETYWVPGFQKALGAVLDEEDADRRQMILNGSLFTRTLWSMTYANISQGQCFECMRVCPVGRETRNLR